MGILRATDKIGALSHSAGNILMAASSSDPAYLTVGGRQFKITSQLSVALPAMTASTRYQIYAVQSGGVVSLVISTNENSVGPAGYTGWKLVGSLISNADTSIGFGSFINIKGLPKSAIFYVSQINITTDTNAVIAKASARLKDRVLMQMNGDSAWLKYEYANDASVVGAVVGTGNNLVSLPTNLQADISVHSTSTSTDITLGNRMTAHIGWVGTNNSASDGQGGSVQLYDATRMYFWGSVYYSTRAIWSSTYYDLAQTLLGLTAVIPALKIQGWSNTPIEDR